MGCSNSRTNEVPKGSIHIPDHIPKEENSCLEKIGSTIVDVYEDKNESYVNYERDGLRKVARPMIERRITCEVLEPDELLRRQLLEERNLKMKRIEKRKSLKLEARANEKWMIFNGTDAYDIKELSLLSNFFDTVIKHVTTLSEMTKSNSTQELNKHEEGEDIITDDNRSDSSELLDALKRYNTVAERTTSNERIKIRTFTNGEGSSGGGGSDLGIISSESLGLSIESIEVAPPVLHLPVESIREGYNFPTGFSITMEGVTEVIQIYRHGGRLCEEAVHKVLRLSYRKLKLMPNTVAVHIGSEDKLTIVGDIHGQLEDLLHILDEAGLPSTNNRYIFNGDFVDRGDQGVEVMILLLTLFVALPEYVTLNRGNHEDYAVCCVYGFQRECLDKYDDVTFGMFIEVFQYLPLFAIVNDAVLVLHGGLFHDRDVTLQDLNEIERFSFSLGDFVTDEDGEPLDPIPKCERSQYLRQLQRDALWSDPAPSIQGCGVSNRGAGVAFGEDVTRQFLTNNNLKMIVRSHECVPAGFSKPYGGDSESLLCTVFSASNYGGSLNSGAYMRFATRMMYGATAVRDTSLFYTVHQYDYAPAAYGEAELTSSTSLRNLVIKKRPALLLAFENADPPKTGFISRKVWADVLQRVTNVKINWYLVAKVLVPEHCFTDGNIEYINFLGSITNPTSTFENDELSSICSVDMFDALYAHHKTIASVFYFFDHEGTGVITRDAFRSGCDLLNRSLPSRSQLANYDEILDLMDIEQCGMIDMNEFFEVCRNIDLNRHDAPKLNDEFTAMSSHRRNSSSGSGKEIGSSSKEMNRSTSPLQFIASHSSSSSLSSLREQKSKFQRRSSEPHTFDFDL